MNKVILQPTASEQAKKHFEKTIEGAVKITQLENYLDERHINRLKEIYPQGKVHMWGVTPGKKDINANKWNDIKAGDVTLFAADKKIFTSAMTTYKVHHKELAKDLWGTTEDGETWEYIYFVNEVEKKEIEYEVFNQAIGYKPNYIIQGFRILDEQKSHNVIKTFKLASNLDQE